ncbi:hypothetical protein C5142_05210 [Rhodococcus sp. BGS-1C]|jgi:hypothetical protein|uniref:CG0192-related protein n=1 Tax=unclassified Rhodococcus (in: high G+C Gram-positive bacteria) TaxID=192944 RepID=UPI0019D28F06|nr:hypothetical protein [Rhodococcus sp. KRD197]
MALIHDAQLSPSKIDMLRAWAPEQPWAAHLDITDVTILGAYRFDDPNGAVGMETFLLASGGEVLQVPLTYRDRPLADAQGHLVNTMQHSVLGERWVYDAVHDPVYVTVLAATILTGGTQAELQYDYPTSPEKRTVTTSVRGSGHEGTPVPPLLHVHVANSEGRTTFRSEALEVTLARVVGVPLAPSPDATLTGIWPGQDTPALLATARAVQV